MARPRGHTRADGQPGTQAAADARVTAGALGPSSPQNPLSPPGFSLGCGGPSSSQPCTRLPEAKSARALPALRPRVFPGRPLRDRLGRPGLQPASAPHSRHPGTRQGP